MARGFSLFSQTGRSVPVAERRPSNSDASQRAPSFTRRSNTRMSKVERLLGTTDLPVRSAPSQEALQRELLELESMTEMVMEEEQSDDDLPRPFSASTTAVNQYRTPPRNQSLRHQASENTLGISSPINPEAKSIWPGRDPTGLRHEQSSTTLQSRYEAHRSPPLVSQAHSGNAYRNGVGEDRARGESQNSHVPDTTRQQKPGRLVSKLFSRPRTSNSANAPDPRDTLTSPSQMSMASEHYTQNQPVNAPHLPVRTSSRTPSVLQKSRPGTSSPPKKSAPVNNVQGADPSYNPKNNVRRPPRGIQNWFDGLLEEEDEDEFYDMEEDDVAEEPTVMDLLDEPQFTTATQSPTSLSEEDELHSSPNATSRYFNSRSARKAGGNPNPLRLHPPALHAHAPPESPVFGDLAPGDLPAEVGGSDTSEGSHSRSTTISESPQSLGHSLGSNTPPAYSRRRRLAQWQSGTSHSTIASDINKKKKQPGYGLSQTGALELSLSDSEDELDEGDEDIDPRLPAVRNSIAISDFSPDNIHIGRARAFEIKSSKRRPDEPIRVPRPLNLDMTDIPSASGSPGMPTVLERPSPRSLSSVSQNDYVRPGSSAATRISSSTGMAPSPKSRRRLSLRSEHTEMAGVGHKLMAVTAEEEALLEMMRSKRAAMVDEGFQEGYRLALQEQERTAMPEGRSSRDEVMAALEAVVSAAEELTALPPLPSEHSAGTADKGLSGEQSGQDVTRVTALSSLTELIEAFPSPSPTSARFSGSTIPRDDAFGSPGLSATSSSLRGTVKRHSNMSAVSSRVQSTPGTSASWQSPILPVDGSDADESASNSGEPSNASTLKEHQSPGEEKTEQLEDSADTTPKTVAGEEEKSEPIPKQEPASKEEERVSEEVMIKASESIVCNNDTDDLSSPEVRGDATLVRTTSAPNQASNPETEELEDDTLVKLNSLPSAPNTSAPPKKSLPRSASSRSGPTSPRKIGERKTFKASAAYRLMPKIQPSSEIMTSHPKSAPLTNRQPQSPSIRSMSVPTLFECGLDEPESSTSSNGPNTAASMSDAAPTSSTSPKSSKSGKRIKPRGINVANVKKALMMQRDQNSGPAPSSPVPQSEIKQFKRLSRPAFQTAPDVGESRTSVSEDVLNAWSNLGGWKGFDVHKGDAPVST